MLFEGMGSVEVIRHNRKTRAERFVRSLNSLPLCAIGLLIVAQSACDTVTCVPDASGDRCVPNEGATHVPVGTVVTYRTNPPASGPHYSAAGVAPVPAGFYEDALGPERWVHNLEHGYVVVLYDCSGDCDSAFLDDLQALFDQTPPSQFGNKKIVITRYPGLQIPIMAVAWDVQRDFASFDMDGLLAFYIRRVDGGPELVP
ncbi:hypothetical protein RAS2_18690 [Phycisphaerae bacterium RAS2]|nr:hypothetical protein RAS2_18690 [Phycisphaerae bacterium RAS2]